MTRYDPTQFPRFAVTVDLVVLTVRQNKLNVLLVRRAEAPFRGRWALPAAAVRADESLDEAAVRVLAEETGLREFRVHLEQLASYGGLGRDPRARVITVAHLALAPDLPTPAGDRAGWMQWIPVDDLLGDGRRLAFDHARILADGVERARAKLEYSPLATAFCPDEFTVGELRRVYEAVWGVALDPRNFHRKVTGTPDFLVPTGGTTRRHGGRPAQLFRRGSAALLNPPMLRPEA